MLCPYHRQRLSLKLKLFTHLFSRGLSHIAWCHVFDPMHTLLHLAVIIYQPLAEDRTLRPDFATVVMPSFSQPFTNAGY